MKYYHKRLKKYIKAIIEDIIKEFKIGIGSEEIENAIERLYNIYIDKKETLNFLCRYSGFIQFALRYHNCRPYDDNITIRVLSEKYLYIKIKAKFGEKARYYFPEGPNRGTYSNDLINYEVLS